MSCTRCDRYLKSSSITVSSDTLTILIVPQINLVNLRRYCLLLAQSIPENAGTAQVKITINGFTYPIYTRSGNFLRADELRCRKIYPVIYGNDPNHFSLINCVPKSMYIPTTTTPNEDGD